VIDVHVIHVWKLAGNLGWRYSSIVLLVYWSSLARWRCVDYTQSLPVTLCAVRASDTSRQHDTLLLRYILESILRGRSDENEHSDQGRRAMLCTRKLPPSRDDNKVFLASRTQTIFKLRCMVPKRVEKSKIRSTCGRSDRYERGGANHQTGRRPEPFQPCSNFGHVSENRCTIRTRQGHR
jgi:hypothetical protein